MGLDDVEWFALGHAFGVATDVPEQLRAVAAGEPVAMLDLSERIERGGTVYPATPAALPFLVAIARDADLDREQRLGVLLLLTRIAAARDASPELLHAVLGALGREEEHLRALLDDREPAVAVAVTALAGRFASPPERWAPRLRELRDSSTDAVARSAYAVALALAEGRPPDRDAIAAAAAVDYEVAQWREREASGLLRVRIGRGSAARLGAILARRASARV